LLEDLVAKHPNNKMYRGDLVFGLVQAYHLYTRLNRPTDAEPALKRALAIGGQMRDAEPAIIERSRALVEVLEAYTLLCEANGRPNRAVEQLDRIVTTYTPWTKLASRSDEVNSAMLRASRRSAEISSRLGDNPGAARRLALAVDLCKPEDQAKVQLELAAALVAAGDHDGAKAAAKKANVGETAPDAVRFLNSLEEKPGGP